MLLNPELGGEVEFLSTSERNSPTEVRIRLL